jgi:hypothetical protein
LRADRRIIIQATKLTLKFSNNQLGGEKMRSINLYLRDLIVCVFFVSSLFFPSLSFADVWIFSGDDYSGDSTRLSDIGYYDLRSMDWDEGGGIDDDIESILVSDDLRVVFCKTAYNDGAIICHDSADYGDNFSSMPTGYSNTVSGFYVLREFVRFFKYSNYGDTSTVYQSRIIYEPGFYDLSLKNWPNGTSMEDEIRSFRATGTQRVTFCKDEWRATISPPR